LSDLLTGRDICNFLEEALAENVAIELEHDDDASMETRLERAFLITDIQALKMGLTTSGATVAICLIQRHAHGFLLHVANAGDARVVLCHDRQTYRLSHDHRADDPIEVERITSAGGIVVRGRVMGILAVARSLGDHAFKNYVTAKPHVKSMNVKAGDFVIVACDGLWDVLTDNEAVQIVTNWRGVGNKKEDISQFLVEEALKRGSADNITCIVSWL
jgi:serine/threonine protein phosphatase PrpC